MSLVKDIIDRASALKAERSTAESRWQRISRVLQPLDDTFTSQHSTSGRRRHDRIYDSSPLVARDNFKAGIYGMMTSPANRWFDLETDDDDLNQIDEVRQWSETSSRLAWQSFSADVSGFYNHVPALYGDVGVFGTACFFSTEIEGEGRFHDSVVPLSQVYIDHNDWGEVDTVYRMWRMTARQIAMKFKDVPGKISSAAEKNPLSKFEIIHAVWPNEDFKEGSIFPEHKAFKSVYVTPDGMHILEQSGFDEMPYMVPRWDVPANERYGYGIGDVVVADVLTLNKMRKTNLTTGEFAATPHLLASDESKFGGRGIRPYPASVTYGAISAEGRPLIQPLNTGANVPFSLQMEDQVRNGIKDSFFFSLMQIVGSTNMTATEFLGRQEEKLRLLGPNLGRIQTEFLTPLIKRRFGMLFRMGSLPPPPPALQGRKINIRYVSPLARLSKTTEATSAQRVLESLMAAAQLDPGVADRFDGDQYAKIVGEGFGSSAVIRSLDEAKKIRDARQLQEQANMAAQAAPGIAKAAKDAVDANVASQAL